MVTDEPQISERNGRTLIDAYPGTCVEGLRKTNKNLGQDISCVPFVSGIRYFLHKV